jgi:hypothetical protein
MSQVSYRAREYLWVVAPLDLEVFCNQFRAALQLPAFHFDAEDVWEWGLTRIENGYVEVNISRKHRHGESLLEEPIHVLLLVDNSAPVNYDREWLIENLVVTYGQTIANLTKQPTHYGVVEYVGGEDFIYMPSQTFEPQTL